MPKRCKNGTRRNKKTGKCEKPKRRLRSNTKRTRRCPNGTRRIPPKTGQCVKRSKKVSVTDAQKKKQWEKLVKRALKVEDKVKSGTIHPGTDEYWKNMKEMREVFDALDALGYKPKEKTHKHKKGSIPKKSVMPKDNVSKYHQKQYEKFMKTTGKDDLKEAFVEKREPESKKEPRYNLRGAQGLQR